MLSGHAETGRTELIFCKIYTVNYYLKRIHGNCDFEGTLNNIQFFFRREQEEFRSRREQRTFWGSGTAFQNSKTTDIFFN
jgi:hypothetical protein